MARTGSPRAAVARKTRIETSHNVNTARPRRRRSQSPHAAPPVWPRGGATSASGSGSVATWVMSGDRHLVELVVPEREVLALLETLHVGVEAVDLLTEAPDDQSALVVLDLLRLLEQVLALGLVELGGRGV